MIQCSIENKQKEKILCIKNRVCKKMANDALDLGTVNKWQHINLKTGKNIKMSVQFCKSCI